MFTEDPTAFLNTDEHADEVTLSGGSTLDAVFNTEGSEFTGPDGVTMVTDKPMLIAATADVADLAPEDTLTVNGTTYRVFEVDKLDVTFSYVWLQEGAS